MSLSANLSAMSRWCEQAASWVRYPPDRRRVREELWNHMDDAECAREASGMPRAEAVAETVRAMGDADEVGRALAKAHPAWKGWLWEVSRALLICVFIVAVPLLVNAVRDGSLHDGFYAYPVDARFAEEAYGTETLLAFWEPAAKASSDGSTFSVTRAARRYDTASGEEVLYFTVRASHPLPWAGEPMAAVRAFSGLDSAGKDYPRLPGGTGEPSRVRSRVSSRRPFSWQLEYEVRELTPGAEWFELYYREDGRSVALRFPLKGATA